MRAVVLAVLDDEPSESALAAAVLERPVGHEQQGVLQQGVLQQGVLR